MAMMNGLAGTLAGMKEDAAEAAKLAGGFVLGVGLAAGVSKLLTKVEFLADKPDAKWAKYARAAVPTALGLALFAKGRGAYPILAGANGLGMMAYGLAGIVKAGLTDAGQADAASWIPTLQGMDVVDTYESNILGGLRGLGGDMSINRYLSPSLNGYSRYPGAPTMVESLQGAPTQFQTLQGAPTSIESLNGLSATLM
jgi:hypothetical protein